MGSDIVCWRTRFEPLQDITTYELALDMKHVNASQIVSRHCCDDMGTALRHRVVDERNGERMNIVWSRNRLTVQTGNRS
jgi:hypothetical protein